MSPLASYVVQTTITLLGVGALSFVLLRGAQRLGVGRAMGPLSVVGRLPLDARRTVYLVRVGEIVYVVAASDAGIVKLGETTERALLSGGTGAPRDGSVAQKSEGPEDRRG